MSIKLFYTDGRVRELMNLNWLVTHTALVTLITITKHSDGGGSLECMLRRPSYSYREYASYREPSLFTSSFADYTVLQEFIRRPSWKK